MEIRLFVLISYSIIGLLLVYFNKQISNLNSRLILFYTQKLKLKDFFLFKIDKKNKSSMQLLTRIFTSTFGMTIFFISIYYIFK